MHAEKSWWEKACSTLDCKPLFYWSTVFMTAIWKRFQKKVHNCTLLSELPGGAELRTPGTMLGAKPSRVGISWAVGKNLKCFDHLSSIFKHDLVGRMPFWEPISLNSGHRSGGCDPCRQSLLVQMASKMSETTKHSSRITQESCWHPNNDSGWLFRYSTLHVDPRFIEET